MASTLAPATTPLWAMGVAMAVTLVYLLVNDPRPPVMRATILTWMMCIAWFLGRETFSFNTLAAALQAAHRVDTLKGDGPVTVDLAAGVAQDGAGNDNTAATTFSITFDGSAPTGAINWRASPGPTNTSPIPD